MTLSGALTAVSRSSKVCRSEYSDWPASGRKPRTCRALFTRAERASALSRYFGKLAHGHQSDADERYFALGLICLDVASKRSNTDVGHRSMQPNRFAGEIVCL